MFKQMIIILCITMISSVSTHGENPTISIQQDLSACSSLGVQKFAERKAAATFSLNDLDGNRVTLKDFRGEPVLLFFWDALCSVCIENMASLENAFGGKRDKLAVLLLVKEEGTENTIREIVKKNNITLPVLLVHGNGILKGYGVGKWFPQGFLIDREGYLVGKILGHRDWKSTEARACIGEFFSLR